MGALRSLGACLLLLIPAGCHKTEGPPLVPVTGTVTLDGRPLAGADVLFIPAGNTPGGQAAGRTGPDGKYTLQSRNGTGATPGEYHVVVSKRVMPDGSDVPPGDTTPPIESPARETLPQYSDRSNPALSRTVPAAGGGTLDLPLRSPGKRR